MRCAACFTFELRYFVKHMPYHMGLTDVVASENTSMVDLNEQHDLSLTSILRIVRVDRGQCELPSQELGHLVWDKRMPDPATSKCFERTTLAPEAQLSNFPSADEEVRYYSGFRPESQVRTLSCSPRHCHVANLLELYCLCGTHSALRPTEGFHAT